MLQVKVMHVEAALRYNTQTIQGNPTLNVSHLSNIKLILNQSPIALNPPHIEANHRSPITFYNCLPG